MLTLLGPDGRHLLQQVEGSGHGGRLSVGLLLIGLGLDLDGRADLLERLGSNGALLRSRLVSLGWTPETPMDTSESTLALTTEALSVLMHRAPITRIVGED